MAGATPGGEARARELERSGSTSLGGLSSAAVKAGSEAASPIPQHNGADTSAANQGVSTQCFRVDVQADGDFARVCPVGDIDVATVGDVRSRIDELKTSGFRQVVLDLREVRFLDAQGIGLVLEADAASRADGWSFALIAGPSNVQRVFTLTGLNSRLPFVDSIEPDGR